MREIMPRLMVIALVISFMIVAAALVWSDNHQNGLGMVQTWKGTYHVGDYIEYYWNDTDSSSGSSSRIWNLTVTDVSTTVEVIDWNYDPSIQTSISSVTSINSTFPPNAAFAFNIPDSRDFINESEMGWVFRGNEPVATPWGILVCQHFKEAQKSTAWSRDYWIYRGIMIKETSFIAPSLNQTLTIKDSNLL